MKNKKTSTQSDQNNGQNNDQTQTTTQNGSSTGQQDYDQLKTELEQAQTKLQEMMVISHQALADLQNFRRRAEEDRMNFVQYANAELLLDLLPAIENINRALAHEPKDAEWQKGVEQTLKQFNQILEKRNVTTMITVGQKFDPKMHEALLTGPGEKDLVVAELEKGYLLGDKVLKRARVKVGDGQTAEEKTAVTQ